MLLAALLALAAAHPNSLSSSEIRVEGARAHVLLRCQMVSLLEVLPDLDADGDGAVSDAELEAQGGAITDYVRRHFVLYTGADRRHRGGTRLAGTALGVRPGPAPPALASPLSEWVDVELEYTAERPLEDLTLEVTLFHETSPGHVDYSTVHWNDGAVLTHVLTSDRPRARSDPEGSGALGEYLVRGVEHILSGWDHLAFLLALVVSAARLRSIALVVTAFTVAHSVTLGLAATHVVDVSRYSSLIEQAIALSIAYVAADVALFPEKLRSRWPEAFGFGLVHGLGFAGFLGQSLVGEQSKLWALVGFNLGVEVGQLLVVVVLAGVLKLAFRSDGETLVPGRLRRGSASALFLLGMYWFVERF